MLPVNIDMLQVTPSYDAGKYGYVAGRLLMPKKDTRKSNEALRKCLTIFKRKQKGSNRPAKGPIK
jgi:hypothetical protein